MDDDFLFFDNFKRRRGTKGVSKKSTKANGVLRLKIENGDVVNDQFEFMNSNDVGYSINKKQRWELVEKFRTNMGSLNSDENVRISALEYHTRPSKKSDVNLGLKAYHSVDSEGREVHKRTKKGYGSEKSLNGETDKHSGRKKRSKKVEEDVATGSTVSHVRLEFLTTNLAKPNRKTIKKSLNNNSGKLKLSNLDGYHLNSSFDDTSSDSLETVADNDDTDFIFSNSDLINFDSLLNVEKRVKKLKNSKNKSTKSKLDEPCRKFIRQWSNPEEELFVNVSENKQAKESADSTNDSKFSDFQLVPVDLLCLTNNLKPTFLKNSFKENYQECNCFPRRFVVDISENLIDKAQKVDPIILIKEIKAQICVEVPSQNQNITTNSFTNVRVYINANVTKNDGSLCLDSINPCQVHSISEIIEGAVKSLCTLHLNSFVQPKVLTRPRTTNCNFPNFRINPAEYWDEKKSLLSLGYNNFGSYDDSSASSSGFGEDDFDEENDECEICFVNAPGFRSSSCGHYFCQSCWKDYCNEKIRSNRAPITCPQSKCDVFVDFYLLSTFLPLPTCEIYANQLRNLEILRNSQEWIWCPTPNCNLLHFSQPTSISQFYCLCGASWCKNCAQKAHWPVSCGSVKRYVFKLHENGDDYIPWFSNKTVEKFVKTKKCPTCKIDVEKVEGCDYVTCVCDKVFCWRCLKPWNHGFDHFGCKEPETELEEFELIDNRPKKSDSFLRKTLYNRALTHRQSNFPPEIRTYKKQIFKIKQFIGGTKYEMSHTLMEFRKQCHSILEFVYVWIGSDCRNKIIGQKIKHLSYRLEFYVNLLENITNEKGCKKILPLINDISVINDCIISEIVSNSC